jgi:hypothetical protein
MPRVPRTLPTPSCVSLSAAAKDEKAGNLTVALLSAKSALLAHHGARRLGRRFP